MARAKPILRATLAVALLWAPAASTGIITGSAHDFSLSSWAGGQICVPCHAPHKANTLPGPVAPLWNHRDSTVIYTLYSSAAMKATMHQPAPMSKLCLSCHDGTVAIDSFGGNLGSRFISPANNLGSDLNVHHPSSFTYDAALAAVSGSLFNPSSKIVTVGAGTQTKTGPVSSVMLYNNQIECSSCHDVHNTFSATTVALMKVTEQGSAICFACHNF
jgi:predicted CXXCH cytochrome family protein